jgi:hypothetical protein
MSYFHRQRRRVPLHLERYSLSPEAQTVSALYAIEREMGFSVQTNILTVWIAATTYFTAAIGILAILLGSAF